MCNGTLSINFEVRQRVTFLRHFGGVSALELIFYFMWALVDSNVRF
jgi:hypothetical protein